MNTRIGDRLMRAVITVAPLLPSLGLCAQTDTLSKELTLGLQVLSHGEVCSGGFDTNDEDVTTDKSHFALNRTRLIVDYKEPISIHHLPMSIEARFVGQNMSIWGAKGNDGFNIYEAWAKLSTKSGLFVQLGRQVLSYDDERIIGPDDWAMTSLSHDVLRLGYEGHGHKIHAILSYNQNGENIYSGSTFYQDGAHPYKSMQVLWYHYDASNLTSGRLQGKGVPLGVSLLFMNIGMQGGNKGDNEHMEWQQLLGGYINYSPERWSIEASYYRQFGHNEWAIPIKAWMASVKATFDPTDNYGFEAGFDYLSGDKNFPIPRNGEIGLIHHDKAEGFSLIYGSHHKFYGAMDFFYLTTYVNGFSPGLQNAYFGGHIKPLQGLTLSARYNYYAMTIQHLDWDKTLGHEIELGLDYELSKNITLSAGYSFMKGTETMNLMKRSNDKERLNWGWVSLLISPTLFKMK